MYQVINGKDTLLIYVSSIKLIIYLHVSQFRVKFMVKTSDFYGSNL